MKTLVITMGEPGGIGPEIALRVAAEARQWRPVLAGDPAVFEEAARTMNIPVRLRVVSPSAINTIDDACIQVVKAGAARGFIRGEPSRAGGRASARAIKTAVELVSRGRADALVTAPISKAALLMAGLPWPGHTEMLADLTGTRRYGMMLMGGARRGRRLRVMLVTIHEALRDVPRLITRLRVLRSIEMAVRACLMLGIRNPRIAVAGLNPHAGEGGMFGHEEARAIVPALQAAHKAGINVEGPIAPDTVFYRAMKGEFDIVVSMYHDQGLAPLKLIGFETGVNVTVGLPLIRTSPDHGTAYEIAWQGRASIRSMQEAIRAARSLRLPA